MYWICSSGYVSNNSWRKLIQSERYASAKNRYNLDDFNPSVWGRLDKWVMNVISTLKNWIMYRLYKKDIVELFSKGYTVNIWMYVWWDINKTYADWYISNEEIESIVSAKYWHSTLINKNTDWQDSYVWIKLPSNITKIEDINMFLNS